MSDFQETALHLVIDARGTGHCVYDERLDLHALGSLIITRGSHVEPDEHGQWYADLWPVGGPKLGPFALRSAALYAERQWLEQHWLSHAQ